METLRISKNKVAGTKQTLRAIEHNNAEVIYIAKDAEEKVTQKIKEAAKKSNVTIIEVETMKELGEACLVKIGTACAAITKT